MKKKYRIALGTDHRGFALKQFLMAYPAYQEIYSWQDCGAYSPERSDYPVFARHVAQAVRNHEAEYGILLCGTGIGMAIAANRYAGVYAGVVWNPEIARRAKEDDNVNVLVFPADYMQKESIIVCIDAWMQAQFQEGRYRDRLSMIDIEK